MEVQIDINSKVVAWLASMGYPVSGMPAPVLRGMLLREARQWQLSPERLEAMILENAWQQDYGHVRAATPVRDAPPIRRSTGAMAGTLH